MSTFKLRQLHPTDYNKGVLELLGQLSVIDKDEIPQQQFEQFAEIMMGHDLHFIMVVEDKEKIIAAATLFLEPKLIHNFGLVGHIEDVVVDEEYRKQGVGKSVITKLTSMAKERGCYKVILDCSKDVEPFYIECGYKNVGREMGIYF